MVAIRKERRYVERKEKFPPLVASPRGCQFSFALAYFWYLLQTFIKIGYACPLIVSYDRSGSGMGKVLLLICVKT